MKNYKENKWIAIAYGVLLLAVGGLTLGYAIADTSVVDQVISIAIAVSLFVAGAINIGDSLIAHTKEFFNSLILAGSIAIAFGVVLCINHELIGSFIIYLLGTFLISLGGVCLVKAILFVVYKHNVGWIIAHFSMATIGIALGIVVLCFRSESKQVLYSLIGATIIVSGIIAIVMVIKNAIDAKKLEKEKQVEVADNESVGSDEEIVEEAE